MMVEPVVVEKPEFVRSELAEMNLDRTKLLEAVVFADRERSFCTGNDIKGFPLIIGCAKAARALRDQFCGEHWVIDDTDNQPGIRHRTKPLRIIPMNMDENAGSVDQAITPRAATQKGAATKSKVRCNKTAWLPFLEMPQPVDEIQTWIFGIGPADENGYVGAEISLPLEFNGSTPTKYLRRIILNSRLEGGIAPIPSTVPVDPTETVDIQIIRK
ncbi:hypothetical protein [Blastomonas aquatica]